MKSTVKLTCSFCMITGLLISSACEKQNNWVPESGTTIVQARDSNSSGNGGILKPYTLNTDLTLYPKPKPDPDPTITTSDKNNSSSDKKITSTLTDPEPDPWKQKR
jgi:hypothetical protein